MHCNHGINRSVFFIAAAMLVFNDNNNNDNNTTLLNVIKKLKQKCNGKKILTNLSFQKQLCILAQREGLLGTKPIGYNNDSWE